MHLRREYGKQNVKIFCQWEKIQNKMVDFSNHRRFTLRCIKEDIMPVSIRLKSNIKTPKGHHIIRKAEKALLNERIRLVNDTIAMLNIQANACKHHLENILDRESMEECIGFIKEKRELRHFKTQEQQKLKFERLCQKNIKKEGDHSNIQHGNHDQRDVNNRPEDRNNMSETTNTNTDHTEANGDVTSNNSNNIWVRNISSTPLTEAEKILSWGPNFAIVPKSPPVGEYIASIEHTCSQLKQGEVEELRGEIKTILKVHPPSQTSPEKRERP